MNSVNYKRLEKSLTDVIQEAQIKIGYDHHPITLYYPTESVARLLGTPEEDADSTERALASLSAHTADTLGAIEVTRDDKRFCFHISAEGTQYVHEQLPDPAFLRAFLQVMRGLTVSFDDILAVFHQFSDKCTARSSRATRSLTTSYTSRTAHRTATATASSWMMTVTPSITALRRRIMRRLGSKPHADMKKGRSLSVLSVLQFY